MFCGNPKGGSGVVSDSFFSACGLLFLILGFPVHIYFDMMAFAQYCCIICHANFMSWEV